MRIYSISKIIAVPVAIAAVVIGYLYYIDKYAYYELSLAIVPLIVVLTIVYVFHGQIDYWWLSKYPIKLDPRIKGWLDFKFPFYQNLEEDRKKEFERRLGLYLEGRAFEHIGRERRKVPEEIKAMIAAHAVAVGFNQKDLLIGNFDRIFLYNHPFGTPNNNFLHIVETEIEDGVLIFALDFLMHAIDDPDRFYNIAYHGYAEAFIKQNPKLNYPDTIHVTEKQLEDISGFPYPALIKTLGYPAMDSLPILITFYFTFNEQLKQVLPSIFQKLDSIFGN